MITVFGTVCLDRVRRIAKLPEPGGYAEVLEEAWFLGGEAANTANALSTWGADVALYGNAIAQDPEGEILKTELQTSGIESFALDEDAKRTPVCDIYVTPDGDRTMFGFGFEEMAKATRKPELNLSPGNWLTTDMNFGNMAQEVVGEAISKGIWTYVNDLTWIDRPEGKCTFWQTSTDWKGARNDFNLNKQVVAEIVEQSAKFAILTDGQHGFYAAAENAEPMWLPPFPAPRVFDSTGAGDIFRAGVLYGLESGWPVSKSLAFAAAAGSLKCAHFGATSFVAVAEEIQAHIGAHPDVFAAYQALDQA